ncbi:hypothetical protein M747DRAFT_96544 [Aspergillus niger ATCC 13496]|uniref:Uncharacterized protein n=1 Tax=Aspergillus niger ATCC 13496 TaxID=1353008 RepID=A0A370BWR3_ASPNG|nr:hypothetical protein M747DRAFT_96544 [Aspergillus niger ATCC 13496]
MRHSHCQQGSPQTNAMTVPKRVNRILSVNDNAFRVYSPCREHSHHYRHTYKCRTWGIWMVVLVYHISSVYNHALCISPRIVRK